jgi:myo-inositol-1(or 4)-monophosphatase
VPAPDAVELATLAASIAEEAGRLLMSGLDRARTTVETKTTGTDMVTEIDRASESLIARLLAEHRPGDGLLAEEGTASASTTGVEWVVDPLDGTTNYLYGFPAFASSLAARVDGTVVAAAVHDPTHRETFIAARGHGSSCNGRPLRVVGPPTLATALLGTGFAYDPARRAVQAELLPRVLPSVRDIRRAGAAALDLCWVGLGRLDAYYEWGLAPWDWAGGSLVAEEAGAVTGRLRDDTLIAAPPQLFDALVALLDSDAESHA